MEELENVDLNNASWLTLEKLPYLSSVIAEGLRLLYGVSSRTPRIAPQEHLIYRSNRKDQAEVELLIPRGTAIGSKSKLFHQHLPERCSIMIGAYTGETPLISGESVLGNHASRRGYISKFG